MIRFRVAGVTTGTGGSCDVEAIAEGQSGMALHLGMAPVGETSGVMQVTCRLRNGGMKTITIASIRMPRLSVRALDLDSATTVVWSFQGASYEERPDWIFPLASGFSRENFMGMNAPDYGGGIPLVDFWSRGRGIALASASSEPRQIALPVRTDSVGGITVAIVDSSLRSMDPGRCIDMDTALVIVHRGDYFNPLRAYGEAMQRHGFSPAYFPAGAYLPEWCAWGYERNFRPAQLFQTLRLAARVGAGWATLDDGWQDADGDWAPIACKFPRGEADMKALVDSIKAAGLMARLWWVPLEAHDSAYSALHYPERMNEFGMRFQSKIATTHPEWFQLNADGSRTQVSWWNSYTLCPALPEVREHYRKLIAVMIGIWGFDGLKIDGQNMNAIPPCYNPAHHHASPDDAPRAVPVFFREIYATVTALKPDAVLQMCPCGTAFALHNLPYVNQPVASDPKNGWQVRLRGKAYKALLGSSVPYSGDHVELTNRHLDDRTGLFAQKGAEDFASTIGVGGVPATKCTLQGLEQADSSLALSPEKERIWKKWIGAYNRETPAEGEYLNLYDIAYDLPETHVIRKGTTLYYAFFADNGYNGRVTLRGLKPGRDYDVVDTIEGVKLGTVPGASPVLMITVRPSLLLKAIEK
jgi:alpha-galactosidase